MRAIALLSLLLCSALMSDGSRTIPELKLEILNQILPKNENEIMIAPGNLTKDCTEVEATLYVLNIDEINELKGVSLPISERIQRFWVRKLRSECTFGNTGRTTG
uniref:Uncharacterized protein n=1 Tax=Photinus pyralis TaxID=7054 RepID=A0A1Y1NGQ9_PHOPY